LNQNCGIFKNTDFSRIFYTTQQCFNK